MVLYMILTDDLIRIRDAIIGAVPTEKIYLFGSHAYGIPHENSDYDLYVIIPNGSIRPIDAMGDIYLAMRGIKRRPTDILAGTTEIFERRSKQPTIERVVAEKGVILYERAE